MYVPTACAGLRALGSRNACAGAQSAPQGQFLDVFDEQAFGGSSRAK